MIKLYPVFLLLLGVGCTSELKDVPSIIRASMEAHNTDLFRTHEVSFDFRDRSYSVRRDGGNYTYTRRFEDSIGQVKDILVNSSEFTRTVGNDEVYLTEMWEKRYGNSVNSVLYFFQLPMVLNDPAAKKTYIGDTRIKGEPYYTIKVTFSEEGGGKDFEDEFRYWIHKETNLIDYLAYNYQTDEGGTRFRQAINRREVDGLVVQDYINYKHSEQFPPLDSLPVYLERGSLTELSRILNTNVQLKATR